MSGSFLLGVPGKLVTLLGRLTATRAGYLDNLTNLDAAITAISPINRIQTGFADTVAPSTGSGETNRYFDVTITAVVTAKSVVLLQQSLVDGCTAGTTGLTAQLTSTTNLRIGAHSPNGDATRIAARWTVVEFK